MNAKMIGLFSGFPARRFPAGIAERLREELPVRDSLVFISAWPAEYEQNDCDAAGMHGMFADWNLSFRRFCVIDNRTDVAQAKRLIQEADCIFLMGGHATQQFQLICKKDIAEEIRKCSAVVLGVSAGACNMAKHALDIWESHMPYDGLGLTDITIKAHITQENQELLRILMQISQMNNLPICAMEDESAVFIKEDTTTCTGQIHWISNGEIQTFAPELLNK